MTDHEKGADEEQITALKIPGICFFDEDSGSISDTEELPGKQREGRLDSFAIVSNVLCPLEQIHNKDDGCDKGNDLG